LFTKVWPASTALETAVGVGLLLPLPFLSVGVPAAAPHATCATASSASSFATDALRASIVPARRMWAGE
jgi:hypothetical protein